MPNALRYTMTIAALAAVALAAAQEPLRPQRTIQERVAQLEAGLATVETRLGLETSRPGNLGGGESGLALSRRVDALENSLEQLTRDLQRVERLAENAARDATQAARDAMSAQQAARDAAMRTR